MPTPTEGTTQSTDTTDTTGTRDTPQGRGATQDLEDTAADAGGGPNGRERLARAQREFDARVVYLNTASLGLPPRRSLVALEKSMEQWRTGRANPAAYDAPLAAARECYARLVGVEAGQVAVGSQVSVFAGTVAASLPAGSEVLVPRGDFTSVVFPFLAQRERGVVVREVELAELAGAVSDRTALVAVSAVQSADGRLADTAGLRAACTAVGARLLLDLTQAAGWLPVDAGQADYTVCGGYKWLLAPRGTCFLTVRDQAAADAVVPHAANWFAGQERWESLYGGPLRLAHDARRFDLSPIWQAWVAQLPALQLLAHVGTSSLHQHARELSDRFRSHLGLPPGESAIVSLAVDADTPRQLERAGVAGSFRAGRLRLAFHLYNTSADTDRAAEALTGHLVAPDAC